MIWDGATVLRSVVLAAFILQTFLVQTHVHTLLFSPPASHVAVSAPHDGKAPLDADHCLFCQEYAHAGAYVTPAAAATLPPTLVVGVIAFFSAPLLIEKPTSHDWMGRAPPRA